MRTVSSYRAGNVASGSSIDRDPALNQGRFNHDMARLDLLRNLSPPLSVYTCGDYYLAGLRANGHMPQGGPCAIKA